jgi:subtilisin family serine protease
MVLAAAVLVAPASGAGRHLSFVNTEPLAHKQWYLTADKSWDFWPELPDLATVKVAVIDSGIDYSHPEFHGRIAAGRSFVPGSWKQDPNGHGTFVAGEIAADPSNGEGIAGIAFNAQLLIAKVVKPDGSVSLSGEVKAIYWAVDHGARVINLSLGGVRDPIDLQQDTYSPLEQKAVQYAYSKGAVLVAAAGNGPESPSTPWAYADYPAALPHVIGVSAIRSGGSVPQYSNRDAAYVDIAAPGDSIFSTIPRNLIDKARIACAGKPYSDCGPYEYRRAIGTSFAAPQVSAAAALLMGQDPTLSPDDVAWLLERSAIDSNVTSGCALCPVGRDIYTGWGRLDVERALTMLAAGNLPPADKYEPNDNAGVWAQHFGPPRAITATLDFWDDQVDVYAITLAKNQELYARLSPAVKADTSLVLWKPGTTETGGLRVPLGNQATRSRAVGAQQWLSFAVPQGGVYYLEVKLLRPVRNPVAYTLAISTRRQAT